MESARVGPVEALGQGVLDMAPWLMKTLSVVGTAAMFMVGGGILTHFRTRSASATPKPATRSSRNAVDGASSVSGIGPPVRGALPGVGGCESSRASVW